MKRSTPLLLASAALLLTAFLGLAPAVYAADVAAGSEASSISKAKESAKAWLALTDAGKYAASWDQAASLFQAAVTKTDWEKALAGARKPFGALKSRASKAAQFARTLPGAPDGEYVVMQFDTAFESKASAVETVTAAKQKDGTWRVAGYFIK